MSYDYIHTIRYMGNKAKLLDSIIPEIEKLTSPKDTICDIMAGTNSIGYALKKRNKIISNDFEYYSYIIGSFMLGDVVPPSVDIAHKELDSFIEQNKVEKTYHFFEENYTDTYFSLQQCIDIDSIRFAIEKSNKKNKDFYLVCLMSAMCKAQSTTGHFAQFMDKNHKRIIPLRKLSVMELFYEKMDDFVNFNPISLGNKCFNLDFNDLLEDPVLNGVRCIYVDSPYTSDQYSRFYHILETVCKYDNPELSYKAKYRNNRIMSDFCYKKTVSDQFEKIISFGKRNGSSIVISYSNHGVIPADKILKIGEKYYKDCSIKHLNYEHSSQGKGVIEIEEVIIILK